MRKIALATKLYDGGKTEKRVYRFSSPPDVAGTGVLVFDYESQADDIWVYLPGLRKTRRVLPFAVPVAMGTWLVLAWLLLRSQGL